MEKKKKVVLVGGGTAGHVLPLFLLAARLKKRGSEVFYFRSLSRRDLLLLKSHPYARHLKLISFAIPAGKWRRYFDFRNFSDLFLNLIGFVYAAFLLFRLHPQLIFSKGGYTSLPVGLAARLLSIPFWLHESDSVMGAANRLLARFAKKVLVSFPVKTYRSLPLAIHRKLVYTGLPVRAEFRTAPLRSSAATLTLLITGGSQGARQINSLVAEILSPLLNKYRLIHLTGERDYPRLWRLREALSPSLKKRYELYPYQPLNRIIHQADLVISRAGATTLFELAAAGKPSILIPLPGSANRHQEKNARYFAQKDAALLLTGTKLSARQLFQAIRLLMRNSRWRRSLAQKIKQLDNPQALEKIIALLETE